MIFNLSIYIQIIHPSIHFFQFNPISISIHLIYPSYHVYISLSIDLYICISI
ncbi:hypothetical protein BJ944DRAFT_265827 [Cunninghamella echinulata]|nr:hypothetical protein BJ944DRAFT_265827 [Cunninghamella echinulata]